MTFSLIIAKKIIRKNANLQYKLFQINGLNQSWTKVMKSPINNIKNLLSNNQQNETS